MSAEEEKAALLGAFTEGKRITYKEKHSTLHGTITYTSPVYHPIHGDPYVDIMITPIVKGHEGESFVIKSSEIKEHSLRIYSSPKPSRRRHSIGGRRMSKTRRRMK